MQEPEAQAGGSHQLRTPPLEDNTPGAPDCSLDEPRTSEPDRPTTVMRDKAALRRLAQKKIGTGSLEKENSAYALLFLFAWAKLVMFTANFGLFGDCRGATSH